MSLSKKIKLKKNMAAFCAAICAFSCAFAKSMQGSMSSNETAGDTYSTQRSISGKDGDINEEEMQQKNAQETRTITNRIGLKTGANFGSWESEYGKMIEQDKRASFTIGVFDHFQIKKFFLQPEIMYSIPAGEKSKHICNIQHNNHWYLDGGAGQPYIDLNFLAGVDLGSKTTFASPYVGYGASVMGEPFSHGPIFGVAAFIKSFYCDLRYSSNLGDSKEEDRLDNFYDSTVLRRTITARPESAITVTAGFSFRTHKKNTGAADSDK